MIEASVPVRICDNGGWTDTWFGGPGRVVNIAVNPGVEVAIHATEGPERVVLEVNAFDERYAIVPGASRRARHPLLEAAVDAFPPPSDQAVEISIRSAVPAGCGAGTSAAVTVALLGALSTLRAERLSSHDIADAAHRLEVDVLGVESGIQDQLSAAVGGINYIEIEHYPEATVRTLPAWPELGPLLTLVFLGRAHDSSNVHRQVIDQSRGSPAFARLHDATVAARDAVVAQDLDAFGRAMIDNTGAQSSLHPELVGRDARRVIEVAATHRSVGWKVNGAGGDGGSMTLLSADRYAKELLEARIADLDTRYRVLPIEVSTVGLTVRGAL